MWGSWGSCPTEFMTNVQQPSRTFQVEMDRMFFDENCFGIRREPKETESYCRVHEIRSP